ncbi:MAG TPA: serine protease [Bacteroidales bacterium]|nr:MAG: hypothetical protein A2X11_07635 [Bacteroidetes bacterium GWE2_42_24]OFY26491.1 MAG: hypothetical protein A2X09_02320 [Bacteroidetes bacterium GWF2_43_11]HAQ64273.1 serine protease [Bacteroidales bacterium]HBZ67698.1 serine protease [Bacteroidales bacterium]
MTRIFFVSFFLLLSTLNLHAEEGMWIPLLLEQKNQTDMQSMGLKLTAADIYNVNQSSLKDAIVLFGGGCTGEVVSDQGLILTNHHCGFGQIQARSTIEHDYLTDGFWAMNQSEELPNPGLTVSFLVSMSDVTSEVLQGVTPQMSMNERYKKIRSNTSVIKRKATEGNHYEAQIRPFYYGNEYYLMIYEIFTDIRLVGTPPSNIGKFGGDTDNWIWPRHTGDFSIFRIYAGTDNKPAPYSKDNIPFKPRRHLSISLKGIQPGDFTFVYGFPGRTEEYLPAQGVDLAVNIVNPIRIALREIRLGIINSYSEKNDTIRLRYAAKHAGIANGWKKWIGESRGIKRIKGVEIKKEFETRFANWTGVDEVEQSPYAGLLAAFDEAYTPYKHWKATETWLNESVLSVEAIRFARSFAPLVDLCASKDSSDQSIKTLAQKYTRSTDGFYKNYEVQIDREILAAMLEMYIVKAAGEAEQPTVFTNLIKKYKGNLKIAADDLFRKSVFTSKNRLSGLLGNFHRKDVKKIENDPLYQLAFQLTDYNKQIVNPHIVEFDRKFDSLMPLYMKAQMEMQPGKKFFPDANSTLRISYGKVNGYVPEDGASYNYYTTLNGIMEKENPEVYDYVVEPKLKSLYNSKDYGRYADASGEMHTCFIATNHTTGGNSGSPVMNGEGQLLGLNFDRCWEGTMSDLMYDPDKCRNISLDIRYCLFIIDKFAGAGHLVKEMTIIE